MKTRFLIFFSLFLLTSVYSEREVQVEPRRGMVGVHLIERDGQFYIHKVLSDTPAEEAGVKQGDLLLMVNNRDLTGLSMPEVLNLFNGDPMTDLEVAVKRGGMEIPSLRIHRVEPTEILRKHPELVRHARTRSPVNLDKVRSQKTPDKNRQPDENNKIVDEKVRKWLQWLEDSCGIKAVLLDEEFGQKLGALFTEGVLVLEVKSGDAGMQAGLQKWDLIYRIEDREPFQYFKTSPFPPANEDKSVNLTLMGLTGEKNLLLQYD